MKVLLGLATALLLSGTSAHATRIEDPETTVDPDAAYHHLENVMKQHIAVQSFFVVKSPYLTMTWQTPDGYFARTTFELGWISGNQPLRYWIGTPPKK